MRTLDEIMKTSPEVPPFPNGSSGERWMANWCHRCHHPVEIAWQKYSNGQRKTQMKGYEGGCPLLEGLNVRPRRQLATAPGDDRISVRRSDSDR